MFYELVLSVTSALARKYESALRAYVREDSKLGLCVRWNLNCDYRTAQTLYSI